ncbi:hypothetical protein GCM10025868_01790 [Angustibacter aerolatus]|uniref:Uncharacterized protein n=1 Tax=Angustibacter aerolatus TaxID=1162965 RepID=A0ABQ6JAW4_9ACTN|nr:hypothetical protein [Angustibacter aerolatus]GMA84929.1 hypothetical protein GCM10025868_01790 [Angustibacter aerolatus]
MTAHLPRAALLAAWGSAVLDGRAGPDEARDVVQGSDEAHAVHTLPGAPLGACDGGTLVDLLVDLRRQGVAGLRAVLPAPGEVLGLPGPPAVNAEALEAGECLVAVGGPFCAVVPEVAEFGSALEPGAQVTWRVHAAAGRGATDHGSVAEAEREPARGAHRGHQRAAGPRRRALAGRRGAPHRRAGTAPARGTCCRRAARRGRSGSSTWPGGCRASPSLAGADDGGSVSGYEAGARATTLRRLSSVGRRALTAAVNEAVARLD